MVRRTWAVALGTVGLLIGNSGSALADLFPAETFTLDNGLEVIVLENRSAPVVSHTIWYRVGAADEPLGLSGLAHYVEHLMFLGTEAVPEGEFNAMVNRNGGQLNAFTSWDYTAFYENVARDRLGMVMELEADRMTGLLLDVDRAMVERDVVLAERRQRIDDDPYGMISEQIRAALFQNHPYGIPIIGWQHEIEALAMEDVWAFYEDWYAPNNAILVVAGDIDAEELRPLAEDIYGQIPARPLPDRVRVSEPGHRADLRLTISHPDVQQVDWRQLYLAPSYSTGDGNDVFALQVLNELFGAGITSRLYRSLVVGQGLATGAGTGYFPYAIDDAVFGIYINPLDGVDVATIEAAVADEIELLLSDGVTEEEVAGSRSRLALSAFYALDGVGSPARTIGHARRCAVGNVASLAGADRSRHGRGRHARRSRSVRRRAAGRWFARTPIP